MLRVLSFLNLLDDSGHSISLTNIGFIAILFKILISPSVDWPSMVSLIGLLVNYMHKRTVNSQGAQDANCNGQPNT